MAPARHDIRSLALGSDNLRGRAGPEKRTSVRAFHVASVVHVASRAAVSRLAAPAARPLRAARNAQSPHVVRSLWCRISHNKYACFPYCGVAPRASPVPPFCHPCCSPSAFVNSVYPDDEKITVRRRVGFHRIAQQQCLREHSRIDMPRVRARIQGEHT